MCAVAPFGHPAMSALRSLSRAVAGSPNRHAGTQDGVYGAASPFPVAERGFSGLRPRVACVGVRTTGVSTVS